MVYNFLYNAVHQYATEDKHVFNYRQRKSSRHRGGGPCSHLTVWVLNESMVWKKNNGKSIHEGKRSLATIITPFWSNNKSRQQQVEESACNSVEDKPEVEDQPVPAKKEVRDKPFVLTHPPSEEVFEIVIKDSASTFVSSFNSSEEVDVSGSVKSKKSFSDKSFVNKYISETLSGLPSFDRNTFVSTDSFTEGSPESINKSNTLPISRSFSFESLKSVSNKSFKSTSEGCVCLNSVSNKSTKSTSERSLKSVKSSKRRTPSSSLKYFEKKRSIREILPETDHTVVESSSSTKTPQNIPKEDPRVEQHQKVLALFQRLDEFHERGCLTQQDYEHYHQLLKKYRSDFYIRKISTYLDQIAKKEPRDIKASVKARKLLDREEEEDTHSMMAETMGGRNNDGLPKKGRVSWGSNQIASLSIEFSDDETKNSFKENDTRSAPRESHYAILEPEDLWSGNVDFDEQQLQELFVEMCFFARLGYAQPPCCLKCTYKETKGQDTTKDGSSTTPPGHPSCRRWVVWRKNADTLLHPNKLDGNILIMQCNVAQKLLDGKVIAGRRWNAEQRRVTALSTA